MEKKWYEKTGWIAASAILFFPIGGFLIWRAKDGYFGNPDKKKLNLAIFGVIWAVFLVAGIANKNAEMKAIVVKFESGQIDEGLNDLKKKSSKQDQDEIISQFNDQIASHLVKKISDAKHCREITELLTQVPKIRYKSEQKTKIVTHGYTVILKEIQNTKDFGEIEELLASLISISPDNSKATEIENKIAAIKKQIEIAKPALSAHEAANYCKASIEKRLKSPSSADFEENWFAKAKMIQNNSAVTVYSYHSYVDAVNSFNAKLRTPFSCTVTVHKGSGSVTLNVSM
jgi:hypothetical protein